MNTPMPRGAIPTPRSEIAASQAYRPTNTEEIFIPSGEFPTPNHELAAAQPYRPDGVAPESHIAWPIKIDSWESDSAGNSSWAEEAFAKACAEPRVIISADVLRRTSQICGSSNFAAFLQTHGFQINGKSYLDGAFHSVDWTSEAVLNNAIASTGPVKIGVATTNIFSSPQRQVVTGTGGWTIYGLQADQHENHCASLFGYGKLAELVAVFERHGIKVRLLHGMPLGLCYAMFAWGSIGIIDQQSLINITGEAWVRTPTTIVKTLSR